MTKIRAALYLRQSLDTTGEGLAIERQRTDCLKIATARGWTIAGEYVDNSISASDRRKTRPGYDALCRDYAAGHFEAIICYDLDRLTRQPRQLEDWIDAASERRLILVTANGEADLSTDAGRLFARIKASVAQAEVDRKAARQRSAALQRSQRGRPPAGVRLTGYTVDGQIVEREAEMVRTIFTRFLAGDSLRSLATWLTESGVPRRAADNGSSRWSPSTVRSILLNPRYAGRAIYRGKPTGEAGRWEPIVTGQQFDAVQAKLNDPRRKSNRYGTDRKHLGSGLYECDVCGRKVYGWTSNRYRCPNAHFSRTQTPIDDLVIRMVRGRLVRADLLDLIPLQDSVEVKRLSAEVDRLRGRLASIEEDYDGGLIDGYRYATATAKVRAELGPIEAKRDQLLASTGAESVLTANRPVEEFDRAPLMIRRSVINTICTVRVGTAPRGRKAFDPWSLASSRWVGDPMSWGDHWRADGLG